MPEAAPAQAPYYNHKIPLAASLGVEAVAAVSAATLVAPFISIIDKAIIANAAGTQKLVPSLLNGFKTLLTKPLYFVRQPAFLMILGVYSGTYLTANCIESVCNYINTNWYYPKFIGTSLTNVTLSVIKDKAFTRMFGAVAPKPLPALSYGLFAGRDSLTILFSFNMPSLLSSRLQQSGLAKDSSENAAQLITPLLAQIISSPMHLLGLDLYNRTGVSTADRLSFIRREYLQTTLARIGRIFPAYSIGGVVNKYFRGFGRGYLESVYGTGSTSS